jgi:pectate lyase
MRLFAQVSSAQISSTLRGAAFSLFLIAGGDARSFANPNDLALMAATMSQMSLRAAAKCSGSGSENRLQVEDGKVVRASLLDEVEGYAKSAGATGGLGGKLVVVTSAEDFEPSSNQVIPGSLRAAVNDAIRDRTPAWIVFDESMHSKSIHLTAPLRLPANITLDGSCSNVTLTGKVTTLLVYVRTKNVVIAGLAFRKEDYAAGVPADAGSAIRLGREFDAVAILHNEFSECGDGCVDITSGSRSPVPEIARATVAFNYFHNHDKVMLFGTNNCVPPNNHCDAAYLEARRTAASPNFFLTLQGNLFLHTGQRHPRVFGQSMAHLQNNFVGFERQPRPDGTKGSGYGTLVSNGARAFVDRNVFVDLDARKTSFAVWTAGTKGAPYLHYDVKGFIRLGANKSGPSVVVDDHQPGLVSPLPYETEAVPLDALPIESALACVASRAGRAGAARWSSQRCVPN